MTGHSVQHATFVIERIYDAPPARVFRAWADPAAKSTWFRGPGDWTSSRYTLDFRVGGREGSTVGPKGGPVHHYDAVYQDIVENERIILSYEMRADGTRTSVSLMTVELKPEGKGTRLTFTEQGAFLDGHDSAGQREEGTGFLLDNLEAALKAGRI